MPEERMFSPNNWNERIFLSAQVDKYNANFLKTKKVVYFKHRYRLKITFELIRIYQYMNIRVDEDFLFM